jgi:hypothetical protein
MDRLDIERLDEMPTLDSGQCCDLKIDNVEVTGRRVWLCRVAEADGWGPAVSIEERQNGKWVDIIDHEPARTVELDRAEADEITY